MKKLRSGWSKIFPSDFDFEILDVSTWWNVLHLYTGVMVCLTFCYSVRDHYTNIACPLRYKAINTSYITILNAKPWQILNENIISPLTCTKQTLHCARGQNDPDNIWALTNALQLLTNVYFCNKDFIQYTQIFYTIYITSTRIKIKIKIVCFKYVGCLSR